MPTQTSVRLREDVEKFIESLAIGDTTKTDVINALLTKMKENMEKGIESVNEIEIPLKETELEKAMKTINASGIRIYFCEQPYMKDQHHKHISELPCIKDPNFRCNEKCARMWTEDDSLCPLFVHKEWRKLISENVSKIL
jgi:hypothetical protein